MPGLPAVALLVVVLLVITALVLQFLWDGYNWLFGWQTSGDGDTGQKRLQLSSDSAVGVVIEGEPGICYEPGLYTVESRYRDGRRYHGSDWSTRTFPVGWTAVRWTGTIHDDWVIADGLVRVADPVRVWYRTEDVDNPIESVLEQCLREEAAGGVDTADLSAGTISERAESYGFELEQLFVDVATHEQYELETKAGQFLDIEILIDEDGPAPGDRLAALRELLGQAVEPGETIADLDAGTINERASTEKGVRVFDIEIQETNG